MTLILSNRIEFTLLISLKEKIKVTLERSKSIPAKYLSEN